MCRASLVLGMGIDGLLTLKEKDQDIERGMMAGILERYGPIFGSG
jgi:hypothetical protein